MKYRKAGGFGDDTDYIEIQNDGEGFIVMKSGQRKPMHWREVRNIPFYVAYGDWEAIDDTANPMVSHDFVQGSSLSRKDE